MGENLRIRVSLKEKSLLLQRLAQFLEIVNFPVLKGDYIAISARERLPAVIEVYYGEPAHNHADGTVDIMTFPVGPPAHHQITHDKKLFRVHHSGDRINQSGYSAHPLGLPHSHASRKIFPYASAMPWKSFNVSRTRPLFAAISCRTRSSLVSRLIAPARAWASP